MHCAWYPTFASLTRRCGGRQAAQQKGSLVLGAKKAKQALTRTSPSAKPSTSAQFAPSVRKYESLHSHEGCLRRLTVLHRQLSKLVPYYNSSLSAKPQSFEAKKTQAAALSRTKQAVADKGKRAERAKRAAGTTHCSQG